MLTLFSCHLNTVPTTGAILDLHFSNHHPDVLATADSLGSVHLYRLFHSEISSSIVRLYAISVVNSPGVLALSLQWHPIASNCLGVTLSTGAVEILQLSDSVFSGSLRESADGANSPETKLQHGLEAWTLAFSPSGRVIFSGGDDGLLLDASMSIDSKDESAPPPPTPLLYGLGKRNIHQAGVTAILPLSDSICITGSYDDHVRVLAIPKLNHSQMLAEENLGGGVWRLKLLRQPDGNWQENDEAVFSVLASCMHAGARVLRITKKSSGQWLIEVRKRFEEHKSMNYGSDFSPSTSAGKLRMVSTSFYDKLVCLWEMALDEL
jgi:diphthamide biosynthesis protein 7